MPKCEFCEDFERKNPNSPWGWCKKRGEKTRISDSCAVGEFENEGYGD